MPAGVRVFTGYNEWFPNPDLAAGAPTGLSWESGPRSLYDPGSLARPKSGPLYNSAPTDPVPYADNSGERVRTFFDDFYNRIYVRPNRVDLGPVSDEVQVILRVWNAFYGQTATLLAVNYNGAAGLGLDGQEIPLAIPALGEATFTLTAYPDGPPAINDELRWNFDIGGVYRVPVTATRSKAWAFEPAWPPSGQTYQITYEYKTEVIISHSGKEQRIALRQSPRKSLAYQAQLSGEAFRTYKDVMANWQHRPFVLPELTRFVETSAQQDVGSAEALLSLVPDWVVPGAALLAVYAGFREVRVVDSVEGSTVTFRSNAAMNWPSGTRLHPALSGYMDSKISAPRLTNAVAQASIKFDVDPLSEPLVLPPAAGTTFNGRELFLRKPNWAQSVDVMTGHEVEILDFDRGPVGRFYPVAYGYETRRASFLQRQRAEVEDLVDFFKRLRGRQGEFYMPTWEYDFVPKVASPALSTSLRVAGTDFATSYGSSTVHKAVFVLLNTGEMILRRVVSVTKVTDALGWDSLITVDSAWDHIVSQESVVMCGWMPVWRMVSDNLVVEWLTDSVAQVSLNMMTLEDLTPETA